MARPTTDPHAVTYRAPVASVADTRRGRAGAAIALALPQAESAWSRGRYTSEYVTSPFYGRESRLDNGSGHWAPERDFRGAGSCGTGHGHVLGGHRRHDHHPEDIGNRALDLGIPLPIATITNTASTASCFPRNTSACIEFEALGKMTGGRPPSTRLSTSKRFARFSTASSAMRSRNTWVGFRAASDEGDASAPARNQFQDFCVFLFDTFWRRLVVGRRPKH